MQRFYLLVLLTFEVQTPVNSQTNLHSLHKFRQKESRITDWHSYVFTYNHITVPFILIYECAEILAYKHTLVEKVCLYLFTQSSGHAVKSSYLHKNI